MKLKAHIHHFFFFLGLLVFIQCSPKLYKSHESEFFPINESIPADAAMTAYLQPFKVELEAKMNTVIGESEKALSKSGSGETALGNLVADFQKEFAEEAFGYPIAISIMNNGGLRNSLPEGAITLGNIYELSPFDNYLYVLELTAYDVQQLAEFAVKNKNLAVNGMFIESSAGELQRFLVDGNPVDADKIYLLVVNDYLANGGDNMGILKDLPRKQVSDLILRDVLIEKIRQKAAIGERIISNIEGRQVLN